MCVLLVVCTTSLIRKIDRALFTFWLYIICRRRCVILIFSVLFSSLSRSFIRSVWICVCCWGSHDAHSFSCCGCDSRLLGHSFQCVYLRFVTKMRYFLLCFSPWKYDFSTITLSLSIQICECCMTKRSAHKHTNPTECRAMNAHEIGRRRGREREGDA